MAAQQCRESERLHGIICCYIGFAFFSPCKFQTGNPSRRCALQGSLWAGLAACCHVFLARSPGYPGFWRCFPKSGTAEDAIQLWWEEVYLQLQWIASKCGNGTGKIKKLYWENGAVIPGNVCCWTSRKWIALLRGKRNQICNRPNLEKLWAVQLLR